MTEIGPALWSVGPKEQWALLLALVDGERPRAQPLDPGREQAVMTRTGEQ